MYPYIKRLGQAFALKHAAELLKRSAELLKHAAELLGFKRKLKDGPKV